MCIRSPSSISRDFPGSRSSSIMDESDRCYKAYYRCRYLDYLDAVRLHGGSWIGRLYMRQAKSSGWPAEWGGSIFGLHMGIFRCNNDEREIEIARRVWISMFWFLTDAYRDKDLLSFMPVILRVAVLSRDFARVWAIQHQKSPTGPVKARVSWLVVLETGRIITELPFDDAGALQPQWERLVDACRAREVEDVEWRSSLIMLVMTINFDYPHSIQRSMVNSRDEKKYIIAMRYVLQHSEGLHSSLGEDMRRYRWSLPAINHPIIAAVESVNFVDYRKRPLCSDLAFVQTMDCGGFYVLVESGHCVGTEECGINSLWQEVLGCDEDGLVRQGSQSIKVNVERSVYMRKHAILALTDSSVSMNCRVLREKRLAKYFIECDPEEFVRG